MRAKIVVCGAGGFVGRKLVEHLRARGHTIVEAVSRHCAPWVTLKGDLTDPAVALRVCENADLVFNLAAQVGGIGFIQKNNAECLLSSLINTNLLRACEAHKVNRYFFASSSCVYSAGAGALSEDNAWPADPKTGYALEKLFSERMCLAFDEEKRVPCTIARFHTLYGPGDSRPPGREHVIEALCKKVLRAKLTGIHEINVWGDGSQTRSFLYVDDCAEGILKLTCSEIRGPVNLSGPENASVNQLIDYLEEIAGIKLERFYNRDAPVGAIHKMTNNTKLREVLNWEPPTKLMDGLRKTYEDLFNRTMKEEVWQTAAPDCR